MSYPNCYQIKLLCHFDQDTDDVSIYNRTPTTYGRINYKSGSNYSKFGYAVYALGPSSGTRYEGRVVYDISDVDLSGQFCIDYWFRDYGSYGGHVPFALINGDYGDARIDEFIEDCPLLHFATNNANTRGFYTYDPNEAAQQFCDVERNTRIHHVAVTRDENNVLRWFYDGELKTSYTNAYDFTSQEIHISRTYSNGTGNYIAIDELRVVSGYPCYTAAFTPPSEPYTIPPKPFYPFLLNNIIID